MFSIYYYKKMINKLIIIQTKNELQNIKNRYQVKYGAAVFDIKIKIINNNIVLEGVVLTERQKKETFLAVQRISKDIKVKNEIKVLAEPKEKLEIGWGIIENSIIDVWGIFPIKKELIEKVRATQAVRGDIVRLLDIEGRYVLVQTQDLAIGWIKGSQILKVESLKLVKKWRNKKRIKINKKINLSILPLVNPSGFRLGNLRNKNGENPNRGFAHLDDLPDLPLSLLDIKKVLPIFKGRRTFYI